MELQTNRLVWVGGLWICGPHAASELHEDTADLSSYGHKAHGFEEASFRLDGVCQYDDVWFLHCDQFDSRPLTDEGKERYQG